MHKNVIFLVLTSTFMVFLGGCASIVNGTNQSVSVNNGAIAGASCSLENDKGKWYIANTPGSVTVHRSYNDLAINCQKRGFQTSSQHVASKTKGMAFGNVVFGGVIGAGVDMANGSAYDYPTDIYVPMQKTYA